MSYNGPAPIMPSHSHNLSVTEAVPLIQFDEEIPLPHTLLEEESPAKVVEGKEWELEKRERGIKEDKEKFIKKFIKLYFIYLKSKEVDDNKGFYKIKLGPYTLRRFIVPGSYGNMNHRLAIYNGNKVLFKVKDEWYNKFHDFEIMKFESEAVYELEEFYNSFIDVINGELKRKEEALDDIDLTNISLKELI